MDDKKKKELKLAENNILIEINVEKQVSNSLNSQNRRDNESKIYKQIEERMYNLRLDLTKEKKTREQNEQNY